MVLAIGLIGVGPAAGQTVDDDPAVVQARQRVEASRQVAEQTRERLDAAADAYERANAHRLRLEDEVGSQVASLDVARARAEAADEAFARGVAASYKHPGGAEAMLAGAVALAPDAGTAMHRAALLERMTVSERLRAQRAQVLAERTQDESRQHTVVRSGVEGAVEQSRLRAEELTLAVTQARAEIEQAQRELSDVEADAERRIAEEKRRAEAARLAAQFSAMSGPLPPVDGKVCPIGAPNGFIDSWGFPRSGGRRHQGVDIFAAHGMPLFAVADGVIDRVFNNRLGGLSINLIDTDGHRYYYAHLSAVHVTAGQRVAAGEVIGANGNSGNARTTPPHLHWQYHPNNGPPVNPYPLAAALCK